MGAVAARVDSLQAIQMLGVGSDARVITGSRLSEAVLGLRSIRRPCHPHVDSTWFREAIRWSRSSGDLLTALCAAPEGVPQFLLTRIESPGAWCDELCHFLGVADETVRCDLRDAFGQRIPKPVAGRFDEVREGLAAVIAQLDDYVSTILDPMWLRVSMALSSEADRIRELLAAQGEPVAQRPTLIVPTVFGSSPEALDGPEFRLVSLPIANPALLLYRSGMPRAPLASLIGHTRTTILYALDGEMTVSDLARVTGQRHGNITHHLHVLCRTNLVVADDGTAYHPARYQRTQLADLLLDSGATSGRAVSEFAAAQITVRHRERQADVGGSS